MKFCFRLLCICRKKSFAKRGNRRRRRLKPIICRNPTSAPIYIPLDLQINTLLRLPVKSSLRFQCVSKIWSSIITSRDFINQHFTITTSSASPRLLISFGDFDGNRLLLVSSPNPNPNPNPNVTSSCVPYKDLNLLEIHGRRVYNSVRGLICVGSIQKIGIFNPSTRKLHVFPQIKFIKHPDVSSCPNYFFGYDPIEDQYKILAVDALHLRLEHKIVVLGRDQAWREAPFACPHVPHTRGLYMNGTIYYGASRTDIDYPNNYIIVSFDVRSETFNMIKVPTNMRVITHKTLINHQGKLGVVEKPRFDDSFRMWVLKDAAKEEWSMNTFLLPQSFVGRYFFNVMDTSFNTGEICLVPKKLFDRFRLFYYNLKKNSMRSVVIEGLPLSVLKRVQELSVTVSDHCESLMLLEETKEKQHHDSELHFI